MILTCPSCGTRYQTDRARFAPPGQNVRCAKCGHVWFHAMPEVEAEPEPALAVAAAAPEPEVSDSFRQAAFTPEPREPQFDERPPSPAVASPAARAARAPRRPFPVAAAAGWLALVAVVGGVVWTTVNYRQTIAELWPRMSSFYALIGMPVNVRGLAFQDVAYTQEFEEGQPVLSITGTVVNVTKRELPVPEIRISLSDTDKHELYHWSFDVGVPTLKPGETKPFVTRLTSPPTDARAVDIRFVQADEANTSIE